MPFQRGEKHWNWKGGIYEYPNQGILQKNRKQKLVETDYHCELCGIFTNRVHHKDKSKTNHAIDNLMTLCKSCHGKLHLRKISDEQIEEIARVYLSNDLSLKGIQSLFGVNYETIREMFIEKGIKRKSRWWKGQRKRGKNREELL